MSSYVRQRVLFLLPTLLGASIIAFFVVHAIPGGAVGAACGIDCTPQQVEAIEEALGLNRPLYVQYADWLWGFVRWDLGVSLASSSPIEDQLRTAIPVTLELGLLGLLSAIAISVPAGIVGALRRNGWVDYLVRTLSIGALALPSFWLAILLIALGARYSFWTPPLTYVSITEDPVANLRMMWVPSILLGLTLAGTLTRIVRAEMLEVLRQDYVRTARAKGLGSRVVLVRHAMRNALLPFVTVMGNQVSVLLGGSVILETIFSLPGMGRYLLTAVLRNDVPVLQTINFLAAVLVVSMNLVVDMSYAVLDPRIRYE